MICISHISCCYGFYDKQKIPQLLLCLKLALYLLQSFIGQQVAVVIEVSF